MPNPPLPFKVLMKDLPDRGLIPFLDALDRLYPDQHPNLKDEEREVWFNAGAREVVNVLLRAFKDSRGMTFNEARSYVLSISPTASGSSRGPAASGEPTNQ